jgi:hypothetical protein
LEGACPDDVQPEVIAAIFEVMLITDELGRGAAAVADPNRAEPHESDLHARVPGAAIYNVHIQNLLCNLLLERGEPVSLGQRLSRDTQNLRRRRRHFDLRCQVVASAPASSPQPAPRRRVAEAAAEHALQMGDTAEAERKGDIPEADKMARSMSDAL